jgi:hypothetical protein
VTTIVVIGKKDLSKTVILSKIVDHIRIVSLRISVDRRGGVTHDRSVDHCRPVTQEEVVDLNFLVTLKQAVDLI